MACWESDWRKRAHPQQAVIDSAPQGILRRRKTHLTEGNASFFCELHDIFDILKKRRLIIDFQTVCQLRFVSMTVLRAVSPPSKNSERRNSRQAKYKVLRAL